MANTKKNKLVSPGEAEARMNVILKKLKFKKINVFDAHRIIHAVKRMEKHNSSDIKDESVSGLIESILIGKEENSVPFLVKLSILNASGKGGNPEDLDDDIDLSDLLIKPEHFVQARAFLLAIIIQANPSGSITTDEIKNCSTVGDVIDLVTTRLS